MCGLVYGRRLDGKLARKMILKRYKAQKSRGKEGFGFVGLADGKMVEFNRTEDEDDILKLLEASKADEVMFHHRMPTSTPNFRECAHPIKVSNVGLKFDYYLIHNGVIASGDELKRRHNELGFQYTTEVAMEWSNQGKVICSDSKYNDSEALAVELAIDLDREGDGIPNVTGSIAFICLQIDKSTRKAVKLFFGRNYGNPLKFSHIEGKYVSLTSEGAGTEVVPHKLNVINYETYEHTEREYKVGGYSYSNTGNAGFGGYGHGDLDDDWEREWEERRKNNRITDIKIPQIEGPNVAADVEDVLENDNYVDLWEEYEDLINKIDAEEDENSKISMETRLKVVEGQLEEIEKEHLLAALESETK